MTCRDFTLDPKNGSSVTEQPWKKEKINKLWFYNIEMNWVYIMNYTVVQLLNSSKKYQESKKNIANGIFLQEILFQIE